MSAAPLRLSVALGFGAVAAVAVIVGLATVGGPGAARLERYDERRVRDVAELANAIERHRIFTGSLPESLDDVRAARSAPPGPPPTRDPDTGAPYDYEVLGDKRFRVCTRLSAPDAQPTMPGPIRMAESRRIANIVPDPAGERLCWESAEPPPG